MDLVVISAGKFEQKLEEVTVSMDVIKPSLIGDKIKCESELVFIEKRKLYFKINVYSWRPGNNTNSILDC